MNELESEFADYLASLWHGPFEHRYRISRSYRWNDWRHTNTSPVTDVWWCNTLSQAARHYSWTLPAHATAFDRLSEELRLGLDNNQEDEVRSTCLAIFQWGGVGAAESNRSRIWVSDQTRGTLIERLKEAAEALRGTTVELRIFDGEHLLMNSAMTKIYSASCPEELAIYDGRVGAALGLIARDFLIERKHCGPVPEVLRFAWGSARTSGVLRDPSAGGLRFPRLFGTSTDLMHAILMHRASRILRHVSGKIGKPEAMLSDLERALFMIGYDVSRS